MLYLVTNSPATTIPAPTDDEPCSMCGSPARYELRHDTVVCSRPCEERWASQFCLSCGANEAEGELHSELCDEIYNADMEAAE